MKTREVQDIRPSGSRHLSPNQRLLLLVAIGVILLHAGFIAGVLVERELVKRRGLPGGDLSLATTVYRLIQEDYYGPSDVATPGVSFEQSLDYGAASGMLGTLDGYSEFLPPRESNQAENELAGRYEGIGIMAEFVDGALVVTTPVIGSPAEKAGIQPGDRIVAVDGEQLVQLPETAAFALIRGPAGTSVRLSIQRAGRSSLIDMVVERQAISVPVVSYRLLPETTVAYIQVTIFGDTTTKQLDEAITRAVGDGASAVILDLRHNGGGWVQSAQEVIGRFVPADSGPALYEDQTPGPGGEKSFPILGGDVELYDLPMAVLVDGATASAAEIVAGALNDYGRATIVGRTTYGKGSVQRVYEFEDGSSARITFAEWLTPDRHRIEGQGIRPDVVVATESNSERSPDAAVQEALSILGHDQDLSSAAATPTASPVTIEG